MAYDFLLIKLSRIVVFYVTCVTWQVDTLLSPLAWLMTLAERAISAIDQLRNVCLLATQWYIKMSKWRWRPSHYTHLEICFKKDCIGVRSERMIADIRLLIRCCSLVSHFEYSHFHVAYMPDRYKQARRRPWNRKYISYRNAARGGPSNGHK